MNSLMASLRFVITSFITIMFSSALLMTQIMAAHAEVLVNINLQQPEHHIAKVTINFNAATSETINFHLPTWRTGRYEILNLANGIREFSAQDEKGNKLIWQKTSKDTWQVSGTKGKKIQLSYQVYANQLALRTRHIDVMHLLIIRLSLCIANKVEDNSILFL